MGALLIIVRIGFWGTFYYNNNSTINNDNNY